MTDISITLDWRDAASDLPESQQETLTQTLLQELQTLDEVAQVNRVLDPDAPDGGMGAQWLWNILTADITVEGIKTATQEITARIPGKPVTVAVKVGEKEISAANVSPKDLDDVLAKLTATAKQLQDDG